jgi:hypothetical protein
MFLVEVVLVWTFREAAWVFLLERVLVWAYRLDEAFPWGIVCSLFWPNFPPSQFLISQTALPCNSESVKKPFVIPLPHLGQPSPAGREVAFH